MKYKVLLFLQDNASTSLKSARLIISLLSFFLFVTFIRNLIQVFEISNGRCSEFTSASLSTLSQFYELQTSIKYCDFLKCFFTYACSWLSAAALLSCFSRFSLEHKNITRVNRYTLVSYFQVFQNGGHFARVSLLIFGCSKSLTCSRWMI